MSPRRRECAQSGTPAPRRFFPPRCSPMHPKIKSQSSVAQARIISGGVNSPVRASAPSAGSRSSWTGPGAPRCGTLTATATVELRGHLGPGDPRALANPKIIKAVAHAAKLGTQLRHPQPPRGGHGANPPRLGAVPSRRSPLHSGTERRCPRSALPGASPEGTRSSSSTAATHGHADSLLVKAGSGALTSATRTAPGSRAFTSTRSWSRTTTRKRCGRRSPRTRGHSGIIVEPVPATRAFICRAPVILNSCGKSPRGRRAAHFRRGDDRLPARERRSAGALVRHPSRPFLLSGRSAARRTPGGGIRRPGEIMDYLLRSAPFIRPATFEPANPVADGGRSRGAGGAGRPRHAMPAEELGRRRSTPAGGGSLRDGRCAGAVHSVRLDVLRLFHQRTGAHNLADAMKSDASASRSISTACWTTRGLPGPLSFEAGFMLPPRFRRRHRKKPSARPARQGWSETL